MEFVKILRSTEEIVFDVAQWPRQIVSLLILSAFKPWRAHALVKGELEKKEGERFKETISPVLFWLLVVILPYFLLLDHFLQSVARPYPRFAAAAAQPWAVKLGVLALLLAQWPLSCSLLVLKRSGAATDHGSRRRLFLTHCLVLSPACVWLFMSLSLMAAFHERARPAQTPLFALFVASTLYAEYAVVRGELPPGFLDRASVVCSCLGRAVACSLVVLLCGVFLILAGSGALAEHLHGPTAVGSVAAAGTP